MEVFRIEAANGGIDQVIRVTQERKTQTISELMRLIVRRHDEPLYLSELLTFPSLPALDLAAASGDIMMEDDEVTE